MKRIVSILAALLLACACLTAQAETAAQPVLFRGIPWGISYAELSRQVEMSYNPNWYETYTEKYFVEGDQDDTYQGTDYTLHAYYTSEAVEAIDSVAGYSVYEISLAFAFLPGGDGFPARDTEHTALYSAEYYMRGPVGVSLTKDECWDDLNNKLTKLYGEPASESSARVVWACADGAHVVHYKVASDLKGGCVRYVAPNCDALLQNLRDSETAAREAAENEKKEAFSSETDGL